MSSKEYSDSILVSVITPAFNASKFLNRCINSVRLQDISCEHIIVDDCSTDDSFEVLEQLRLTHHNLVILKTQHNSGPLEARNLAIKKARGRFLAFLDVDDVWLPMKLHTQLAYMKSKGVALSFTDYRFITEDGLLVGRRIRGPSRIGWHLHHMTRYLGCLTVMVDRSLFPNFNFPQVAREVKAEDFLAWSQIIQSQRFAYRCPEDLARYSVVKGSRSSNGVSAAKTVWRLYREVEKIFLLYSLIYFLFYMIFSIVKRFYCKPRQKISHSEKAIVSLKPNVSSDKC